MNTLEMETYAEPDFSGVLDEFCDDIMTPEQKEAARKKTEEMYNNFTDDDWRHLGDNY